MKGKLNLGLGENRDITKNQSTKDSRERAKKTSKLVTKMVAAKLLTVAVTLMSTVAAMGPCPNDCSERGSCRKGLCVCYPGWSGGDCSQRDCPVGTAWADEAIAEDNAHNLVECSNRGKCDRSTGKCICDEMFDGRACERMLCPYDCWGNGRCLSMKEYAAQKDRGMGMVFPYENAWDANKIFGCLCDSGYHGYDCSLRDCPSGDDPLTTGQRNEVQLLQCDSEKGFFVLTFYREKTAPIPVNATLEEFKAILQATKTIGKIDVKFSEVGYPICTVDIDQVASIEFLDHTGDIPSLVVVSSHTMLCSDGFADLCGGSQVIVASDGSGIAPTTGLPIYSFAGSRENEYCSNRGYCSVESGDCSCYDNFVASNGKGDQGIRGDCGYAATEISVCPGLISCSGHGYCNTDSFRCVCSAGWTSGDCSMRSCPKGRSWFDLPVDDDRAHELQECSNMGICDQTTGQCACRLGFSGAACERMDCPGTTSCSGHGTCLNMASLAMSATKNGAADPTTYGGKPLDGPRWDFASLYGCICDDDFTGHDCSQRICPRGTDPDLHWRTQFTGDIEVQAVKCTADGGYFQLGFRSYVTPILSWNSSSRDVEIALDSLPSIHGVLVEYSSGASFCTQDGSNAAKVSFLQDFGDLPALEPKSTALTISSGTPALQVATDGATLDSITTAIGSRQNIECSGRGICDFETGRCQCFEGYGSSDGNGKPGTRGDCGWKIPYRINKQEEIAIDYTNLFL